MNIRSAQIEEILKIIGGKNVNALGFYVLPADRLAGLKREEYVVYPWDKHMGPSEPR